MPRITLASGFLLVAIVTSVAFSQDGDPQSTPAGAGFTSDYPMNRPGIFIRDSSWKEVLGRMPSKTKTAHGIAASLSYGVVPAKIVAEYAGEHALTQVGAAQPSICICHMLSLPADPVIVQLHPRKGLRELDGGRMIVYPVVGGSKMADAKKSDLIPVDQIQPEQHVWLIRPESPLAPGEYALMLGTQNMDIFPFTVTEQPAPSAGGK